MVSESGSPARVLGGCRLNETIFQIYISDEGGIPAAIASCVRQVSRLGGGHHHVLLDGTELRRFIAAGFDERVLRAYERLVPYAYKTDLGRYCLLYRYGGWYVDAAVNPHVAFPMVRNHSHVVFRDAPAPNQQVWEAASGVIFARAGSRVMRTAIDLVVENCEQERYGVNALDPTGPGVLGRALASVGPDPDTVTGMYLPLTPGHALKNYAFVLPDGRILAWGKRTHGTRAGDGLESLGARGTNSYARLYKDRAIFSSDSPSEPKNR